MERKPRTKKEDMIENRTNAYFAICEKFQDGASLLFSPAYVFHLAIGPWKAAARECNLQYRRGYLYTGNNHLYFPLIYMPSEVTVYPSDMGEAVTVAKGGFWVVATPEKNGKIYRLDLVKEQAKENPAKNAFDEFDCVIKRIANGKGPRCIKKATFDKLLNAYAKIVAKRIKLAAPTGFYSGWKADEKTLKPTKYEIWDDTILDKEPADPFRVFQNPNHMDSALSSVLFCATLFSVSKPILTDAKLPTSFLLYLAAGNKKDFNKNYYWRQYLTCFYCNPNKCEEFYHDFGRFEQDSAGSLSPYTHHNFPLLYSKADPDFDEDENMPFFTRQEAALLKKAAALPILLSPIGKPEKKPEKELKETSENDLEEEKEIVPETTGESESCEDTIKETKKKYKARPFKGCLTLSIRVAPNDQNNYKKTIQYRDDLFDFYSGFLNYLSENPKERKASATKYYTQALQTLYCTKKTATEKQTQIACLLTALYLAEEYINQNVTYPIDPFLKTKILFQFLGGKHLATEVAFAGFLQELSEKTEPQSPLLLQDGDYLYLNFKEYWGKFVAYCELNDIVIQGSEKGFRKLYLAEEFLKPQYAAKPGTYPRYDCRKLIGNEKKTVLVVKKEILQYARKPAKAEN